MVDEDVRVEDIGLMMGTHLLFFLCIKKPDMIYELQTAVCNLNCPFFNVTELNINIFLSILISFFFCPWRPVIFWYFLLLAWWTRVNYVPNYLSLSSVCDICTQLTWPPKSVEWIFHFIELFVFITQHRLFLTEVNGQSCFGWRVSPNLYIVVKSY